MVRKIYMPTAEEDSEITAAAMADPDAQPLTDDELASMVRFDPTVVVELTLAEAPALALAAEAGSVENTLGGTKKPATVTAAFRRADRKLRRTIAVASKSN